MCSRRWWCCWQDLPANILHNQQIPIGICTNGIRQLCSYSDVSFRLPFSNSIWWPFFWHWTQDWWRTIHSWTLRYCRTRRLRSSSSTLISPDRRVSSLFLSHISSLIRKRKGEMGSRSPPSLSRRSMPHCRHSSRFTRRCRRCGKTSPTKDETYSHRARWTSVSWTERN